MSIIYIRVRCYLLLEYNGELYCAFIELRTVCVTRIFNKKKYDFGLLGAGWITMKKLYDIHNVQEIGCIKCPSKHGYNLPGAMIL